jgi:putative hydrolase
MNQIPFGFTPDNGDGKPFDMSSLGAMLEQLGAMMQRTDDLDANETVSWSTIEESARKAISSSGDPSITPAQVKAVQDSVHMAQIWLDESTVLPISTTSAHAWSRTEWLLATLPQWKPLVNPVAEGLSSTVQSLTADGSELAGLENMPPELMTMMQPLMAMAKKMSAVTTGLQIGQGFAELSKEMLSAGDISVALTSDFVPALLPNHITDFAKSHEMPVSEVMVFVAVREAAIQRLFSHHAWLRTEVADSIARYARGISIDQEHIKDAMSSIDPTNPESMQQLMSSGIFQTPTTPEQQSALNALELTLAIVEGWVTHVASQAIGNRLASAAALVETFNRRRASGGPAEKAFANLVGLELRPRLVRDAISFWASLTETLGIDERDAILNHPDFLPSAEDLTDPASFITRLKSDEL